MNDVRLIQPIEQPIVPIYKQPMLQPLMDDVSSRRASLQVDSLAWSEIEGKSDHVVTVPAGPLELFKRSYLRGISITLFSKAFTGQYGHPTCIQVWDGLVVGTSRGYVVLYNLTQKMYGILGEDHHPIRHGMVTCLAVSPNRKQLVVGHQKGYVILWDLVNKSIIKSIVPTRDAKQGHASRMVSVAFIKADCILSADDQGVAYYHVIRNRLVVYTCQSTLVHGVLDKSSGDTTLFDVSALHSTNMSFPGDVHELVAISSPYKI